MTQKGLAPILIVLILAFLVGGYFVYQNQVKSTPTPQSTTQPSPSPRSKDEETILQLAKQYLSSKDNPSSPYYASPSGVNVEGDWAVVYIVGRDRSTNAVVAGGVGIMLAHSSASIWDVARSGDPQWKEWLDLIPSSLIKQDDKIYLR